MDSVATGVGDTSGTKSHPATMSPVAAAQSSCLKILTLVRTLLQSEGQAIMIRDSHSETGFNVIYTGNAISWANISPSTFGKIPSISNSLVESVLSSRATVVLTDCTLDASYNRCKNPF